MRYFHTNPPTDLLLSTLRTFKKAEPLVQDQEHQTIISPFSLLPIHEYEHAIGANTFLFNLNKDSKPLPEQLLFPASRMVHIFKLYTTEGVALRFGKLKFISERVTSLQKKSDEFKSILRSPLANKNAQEQFKRLRSIYTVVIPGTKRTEKFLKQIQADKTNTILAVTVTRENQIIFQSDFGEELKQE